MHTHKHTEYTLVNAHTHTQHLQRLKVVTEMNSDKTFNETNPGIKKNPNPIKTVAHIKAKGSTKINH